MSWEAASELREGALRLREGAGTVVTVSCDSAGSVRLRGKFVVAVFACHPLRKPAVSCQPACWLNQRHSVLRTTSVFEASALACGGRSAHLRIRAGMMLRERGHGYGNMASGSGFGGGGGRQGSGSGSGSNEAARAALFAGARAVRVPRSLSRLCPRVCTAFHAARTLLWPV